MGFFQSDCARNGDLKGNLFVCNSPKHELRQWKDKVTAQKHCSPPIEKFSFSSSLRLKNRRFSQTESAFAFKLAGVINYTSIYTIDKIFFIFENVAFSLSLNLEIAYSEKLRPLHFRLPKVSHSFLSFQNSLSKNAALSGERKLR